MGGTSAGGALVEVSLVSFVLFFQHNKLKIVQVHVDCRQPKQNKQTKTTTKKQNIMTFRHIVIYYLYGLKPSSPV